MNISKYIKEQLKEQGRSQKWLADKMLIDDKTFAGKLNRDSITAQELLQISSLLDLDLNTLMEREADVIEDNAVKKDLLFRLRKDIANKFRRGTIEEIKLIIGVMEWKKACPNYECCIDDTAGVDIEVLDIEDLVDETPNISANKILSYLIGYEIAGGYRLTYNLNESAISEGDYEKMLDEDEVEYFREQPHFISSVGCIYISY